MGPQGAVHPQTEIASSIIDSINFDIESYDVNKINTYDFLSCIRQQDLECNQLIILK